MNATATAAAPALTTVSPAAAHVLRTAQAALAREEAARDALAASLTRGREITGAMFQNVMDAAAAAAPWRDVLRLADRMTVAAALASVRQQATRALLEHGETTSTSALTNEERRTRREGLRGFLWSTEVAMDALENEEPPAPAPVPAPEPTPAPAPAPAATSGRRPTDAQLRLLQLIHTGTVVVRESGRGGLRAYCPTGNVNIRAVETACRNGWAERDNTTSLYVGQKVTLTPEGRAHLPS